MRLLLVAALLTGCSASLDSSDSPSTSCAGPLGDPKSLSNINAMTACCEADQGQAHCLDAVPAEIQPFLAGCPAGGYCVPDSFLETGASVPPATCTAFGGSGVCLSRCIPQVSENAGLLKPDTCTGVDELCVPCINPLDQMPTGACDLLELARCEGDDDAPVGPDNSCDDPATCNYESTCPPVIDPSTLTACGPDAHCLDAVLAGDQADKLGTCDDGVKLCVPDTFISSGGKFTPATCKSVGNAEGRCLSTVLPDVKAQEAMLPQDVCGATEKCTPCFNPVDGSPTGACSLSCDTGPVSEPVVFAECCDGRARCVPTDSIPDDQEGQLSDQECEDDAPGSLCVPNEILTNGPFNTCAANSFILGDYTGVCLSTCLDFGIQGIALSRGDCDSGFKCAPCEQNGEPTGAPGCPPQ